MGTTSYEGRAACICTLFNALLYNLTARLSSYIFLILLNYVLCFRLTMGTGHGHGSSFLGLLYRILNMNHKKELPWSLWALRPKPS